MDPDKKSPSVSLALVILSTICVLVGIGMNYSGRVVNTDLAFEFWSGSAMLYFGRKIPWAQFTKSTKKGNDNEKE
jgi:hypothetical protein